MFCWGVGASCWVTGAAGGFLRARRRLEKMQNFVWFLWELGHEGAVAGVVSLPLLVGSLVYCNPYPGAACHPYQM